MGRVLACIAMLLSAVPAAADPAGREITGVVLSVGGAPVAQATVVVTQGETFAWASTDGVGRFRVSGVAPGPYQILATFAGASVTVEGNEDGPLTLTLKPSTEVIRIKESAPVNKPAELVPGSMPRHWQYSDEAIDRNEWAVVWVEALIDTHGNVARARIIKSPPGFELEDIALAQVKKLHYQPARDLNGRPTMSVTVVVMEWPPYWGQTKYPPCKGRGPLNLDDLSPTYRDCDPPKGYEHMALQPLVPPPASGSRGRPPPPPVLFRGFGPTY